MPRAGTAYLEELVIQQLRRRWPPAGVLHQALGHNVPHSLRNQQPRSPGTRAGLAQPLRNTECESPCSPETFEPGIKSFPARTHKKGAHRQVRVPKAALPSQLAQMQ